MQTVKLNRWLCALLVAILAVVSAPPANAIFSPTISNSVKKIKQDVARARQINGTGSIVDATQKVLEYDRTLRQEGRATGLCGLFMNNEWATSKYLGNDILASLKSFELLLGYRTDGEQVSDCLADDIWELQAIRDEVVKSLLLAGILCDATNNYILYEDLSVINSWITLLENPEDKLGYRDTAYLFGPNAQNYYLECPYNEFSVAYQSLTRSFDVFLQNLKNIGSAASWKSVLDRADLRAKKKADEWIQKNRLSITLGGGQGGEREGYRPVSALLSLFSGGQGAADNVAVYSGVLWKEIQKKLEYGHPLFGGQVYDKSPAPSSLADNGCVAWNSEVKQWEFCTEEQYTALAGSGECALNRCVWKIGRSITSTPAQLEDLTYQKEMAVRMEKQAKTALKYQIQFNAIADTTLADMDKRLFTLNETTKRAFEEKAAKSLPTFCRMINTFSQMWCPNQPHTTLDCQ